MIQAVTKRWCFLPLLLLLNDLLLAGLALPSRTRKRLWPLPVVQPWQETPEPGRGWVAKRGGPAFRARQDIGNLDF